MSTLMMLTKLLSQGRVLETFLTNRTNHFTRHFARKNTPRKPIYGHRCENYLRVTSISMTSILKLQHISPQSEAYFSASSIYQLTTTNLSKRDIPRNGRLKVFTDSSYIITKRAFTLHIKIQICSNDYLLDRIISEYTLNVQ